VRRVIVSHPHAAAIANATARAMSERGCLARYITGVAWAERSGVGQLVDRRAAMRNRLVSGLMPGQIQSLAPVEWAARATSWATALLPGAPIRSYDAMFVAHDAAVAALPWPQDIDGVYAYEDGALRTFRRAARLGVARVWDLPAPHYLSRERTLREEARRWPGAHVARFHFEPEWKRRRKDAELQFASTISVASAYTRSTLEEVGTRAPIIVTPYGFPVKDFPAKEHIHEGPFTVLSVGTHTLLKGTPYLLEAWRKAGVAGRLRLVGPLRLTRTFLDAYAGLFEHVPHLPRALLGEQYRAADLLAFPSLGDGFGLVIQEAMCSGTPVIATHTSGGPECICNGVDGWIVRSRDMDALVTRIRDAAADRDAVFRVGQAARRRTEQWTWAEAGAALARSVGCEESAQR
jgi:alpha-maltose-1-phosphate synthase